MIFKLLIALLIFSTQALPTFSQEEANPLYFQDLKEELPVTKGHFGNERLINIRNKKTGLEVDYQTKNDLNRVNFSLLFNSDFRDFLDIRVLELGYGIYYNDNLFIDLFLNSSENVFDSTTEPNSSMTADSTTLNANRNNIFIFGAGFTYRSNYIRDFLTFENIYETVSSTLGFAWMMEELSNRNYFGPGIKADLGIHYRASQHFHFGIKLSWNHYSTIRSDDFDFEDQNRRHLALTWLALGLDVAMYY